MQAPQTDHPSTPEEAQEVYKKTFEGLKGNVKALPEEALPEVATGLATDLHHIWRVNFALSFIQQGKEVPARWKPIGPENEQWQQELANRPDLQAVCRINPRTGTQEIDIASTDFKDLPPSPWKSENLSAARDVVRRIHDSVTSGKLFQADSLITISSLVDVDWLVRNPHVFEPSDDPTEQAQRFTQRLPFYHLPADEQNKDIVHAVLALARYRDYFL